jgi:hypothetical protein
MKPIFQHITDSIRPIQGYQWELTNEGAFLHPDRAFLEEQTSLRTAIVRIHKWGQDKIRIVILTSEKEFTLADPNFFTSIKEFLGTIPIL